MLENCLILLFLVFLLRFFPIKKIILEDIDLRKEIKFLFAIAIIIFCLNIIIKFMPNPRYKKFLSDNNIFAVIEDKYDFKNKIQIINDQFYIPIKLIKMYVDEHIFYDKKENKIVITDKNRVIKLKLNDFNYTVNENEIRRINFDMKKIGYEFYLPEDFVKKIYDLEIDYQKKYNLLKIDFNDRDYFKGEIKKNCYMRYEADKKSFKAQKILKGEQVKIYGEQNNYLKIKLESGLLGYVKKENVINKQKIYGKKKSSRKIKNQPKIKMVWDGIYNQTANYYALKKRFDSGINVISPTWFSFDKKKLNGELINLVDINYVKTAQKYGIKVCPSLSDELDYQTNHEIITDGTKREFVIEQIINFADEYDLDGINIDFEGVKKNDIDFYIEFLRELSPLLKKRNLILIVDVFVPDAWSMYYNRKEIAETADYICVMAYDEYNLNSDEPGPVASYDFVLNGIKNTLKEVSKDKIIIGLPFYTRIWHTKNNKFKIENVSMQVGFDFFKKRNVEFKWLDDKKYFYCEYENIDENIIYKSWLEDENSIEEKLKLVKKFDLAGISGWKRGFEKKIIWELVNKYIN